MSYTNKDLDNGIAYSNNRYTLRLINILYKNIPHIISHMQYSIEQADPDNDYYYPSTFALKAIKVTTKIPQNMCEKISCNSITKEGSCSRTDKASYYVVGDAATFSRQCEPSCYNLRKDPIIDEETGDEQVQMIRLEYNNLYGCIMLPTAYVWHERPFFRSESVYEHRLNDLPTGFNRGPNDDYTYSGLTYTYNKSYCDAFYDKWDPDKQTCVKKWWETVLYAVVGESIIKLVKAGIQSIKNGDKSDYPPVNFPPIPDIEPEWTVSGWLADINDNFILPPNNYELPPTKMIQRECSYKNHEKLEEPNHVKNINIIKNIKSRQQRISSNLRRKLEENYELVLTEKEVNEIKKVKMYNKTKHTMQHELKLKNVKTGKESDVFETLMAIIEGLMSSLFDPAFWVDIGIGIISDAILDQIKVVFRKMANEIIPKLTAKILALSGKVMSKVFAKSVLSTIANTMSKLIIKTISKVMIKLTKLMAEVASVVGIILAILTFFDILLTIWDPLGFNNKFDPEILTSVTRSSDIAMRQSLGTSIPELTFEIFANMVLTPEEIIDESLHVFSNIYEYLDSLTVNSEGSRIDKGDELDFDGVDDSQLDSNAIANTKVLTPKEFYDYEINHSHRMKFFKTSTSIITGIAVVGCFFMIIDMWIMALLIFIIALAVAISSYVNGSWLNVGKLINDTSNFKIQ
ncbi:PIF-0 [Callinectes sapidus nudivirus]|nr:PIF-0 [Callinectes sapidus nudivirus]